MTLFVWVPYGRPRHCVLPRREAHRERMCRYLRGVRTESPDNAFYFDDKHTMNVYVVICVVSAQKAPALCFSTAISTQWTYWSLFVWVPYGRPRYCILLWRKAHNERIYRFCVCSSPEGPGIAFYLSARHTLNVYAIIHRGSHTSRPGMTYVSLFAGCANGRPQQCVLHTR